MFSLADTIDSLSEFWFLRALQTLYLRLCLISFVCDRDAEGKDFW